MEYRQERNKTLITQNDVDLSAGSSWLNLPLFVISDS